MSTPGLDERQHAAVLKAAIDTALGDNDVYEYGEVPGLDDNGGAEPMIYALLSLERRYAPADRQGRASRSGWRVAVRAIGSTPNECRWAAFKVATALDGKTFTIGGVQSSPLLLESSDAPNFDKGRYASTSIRTYTL